MKRLLFFGGVMLLFLTFGASSYAYQVDANVTISYDTGIYNENYFNSVLDGVDLSSLTEATLSVLLQPVGRRSAAAFYINGSQVESAWNAANSPWTTDVLPYLQDDGNLTIGISARAGTLTYLGAELALKADQAAHSPIPPTILLFGAGLVGLVGFRKKFKMA